VKRLSTWLVLVGLVLVLGTVNRTIWQKEQIRTGGREVLLELAPVDPRSLIQGDYMMLRYAESTFPNRQQLTVSKGTLVLALDDDNVGTYVRMDDGSPLAANELRLKFRTISERGEFGIGAESYFFQEGHAGFYERARYGVVRVDESGNNVLVGLADENHEPIRPPAEP